MNNKTFSDFLFEIILCDPERRDKSIFLNPHFWLLSSCVCKKGITYLVTVVRSAYFISKGRMMTRDTDTQWSIIITKKSFIQRNWIWEDHFNMQQKRWKKAVRHTATIVVLFRLIPFSYRRLFSPLITHKVLTGTKGYDHFSPKFF